MKVAVGIMTVGAMLSMLLLGSLFAAKQPLPKDQFVYSVSQQDDNINNSSLNLFIARYHAAHHPAIQRLLVDAQPYDMCQACILQCGGPDTDVEECLNPCSRACGLETQLLGMNE